MYRPISSRPFKTGDRVLVLKGLYSSLGEGIIRRVGIHKHKSKIPLQNIETLEYEWLEERIPSADVEFEDRTCRIPLEMLVTSEQVLLYESLQTGDLVTYGRNKQLQGVVISNFPRRKLKNGIIATQKSVMILEDGIKKHLAVNRNITRIQRAKDFLYYS